MGRWLPHLIGLITPLVTIVGILAGGWWMGATLYLALGVYPILDLIAGQSSDTNPLEEGKAFNYIVHAHAILVPLVILVLLYTALVNYTPFVWLGALSVGLSSGASGIVTAHELGHRRPRSASWWLSRLDLMCVLYLHFTIEHNYTHHKHWAKSRDPTSSPWGRNVYYHFIRTIPLQVKGAYRAKPKDVKVSMTVQGIMLLIMLIISPIVLGVFLLQAFVAIYLLEFVNYLQHHGLVRQEGERANASHAWESRHRWSRWTLLELPLHPSHHLKASTPYQKLDSHDESPQLPNGYYVMFWTALIPPLFHHRMKQSYNAYKQQVS
ncbi:MAG TPA: hypothetical protein D7H81_03230 [Candidatus Poseidoniales archaeon]|nr:MAG TPA: hypothetical protein D7H81_03230 [Candidatus Poseidoniales archaeon]|tara:strand:- start:2461 stop:3429 length:969 start_codon:yes stop_codon:yes gene_type:complete